MSEALDSQGFAERLARAARHIRSQVLYLSELDAAIGDGDHGATMGRVCDAILAALEEQTGAAPGPLCEAVGWAVMCTDGGSTSPLLGSFFLGMGESLQGAGPLDAGALHAAFAAGLANLCRQTPARPGGKTLIDALAPAVEALGQAAAEGAAPAEALTRAAAAAAAGADATRPMKAAHGRARNLGERTVGHVDPGAASMALFFAGFAQ